MKPKPFDRFADEDEKLVQLQDRLEAFFKAIEDCPLVDGRGIEDVAITSGTPLEVEHLLGRVPEGYVVTKRSAGASVFHTAIDDEHLTLDASANVTVNLWVY